MSFRNGVFVVVSPAPDSLRAWGGGEDGGTRTAIGWEPTHTRTAAGDEHSHVATGSYAGLLLTTRHHFGGGGGGAWTSPPDPPPPPKRSDQTFFRAFGQTKIFAGAFGASKNPAPLVGGWGAGGGRTGDCPGPYKETTTGRNVTQGGGGGLDPPPPPHPPFETSPGHTSHMPCCSFERGCGPGSLESSSRSSWGARGSPPPPPVLMTTVLTQKTDVDGALHAGARWGGGGSLEGRPFVGPASQAPRPWAGAAASRRGFGPVHTEAVVGFGRRTCRARTPGSCHSATRRPEGVWGMTGPNFLPRLRPIKSFLWRPQRQLV